MEKSIDHINRKYSDQEASIGSLQTLSDRLQEVQRDVDKMKEEQVTETRVEVMFRDIMVGQELVNKDTMERGDERLNEKLEQLQEEISSLKREVEHQKNEKGQGVHGS